MVHRVLWREKQYQLLNDEIEAIFSILSFEPDFRSLVKNALHVIRYGLGLGDIHEKPWPLLPLIVCEAISGKYDTAIPAAAIIHLIKASAETFDDIEDADSPDSLSVKYGTAIALNLATTYLILAENAVIRLKTKNVDDGTILRISNTINSLLVIASAGQHLDLSTNPENPISEELYLKILEMKSAFITSCACSVGAMLAGADEQLIDMFTEFGKNLGVASQLANDILGITRGNDIKKHKVTLPLIYAIYETDSKTRKKIKTILDRRSTDDQNVLFIKEVLFKTGSIYYAATKIELFKQKALDCLNKIENQKISIKRLKPFLQ